MEVYSDGTSAMKPEMQVEQERCSALGKEGRVSKGWRVSACLPSSWRGRPQRLAETGATQGPDAGEQPLLGVRAGHTTQ